MVKITVNVEGMMCPHCEAHVNEAIKAAFQAEDVVSSHEKRQLFLLLRNMWTKIRSGKLSKMQDTK